MSEAANPPAARGRVDRVLFGVGAIGLMLTTAVMMYVVVMRYAFNKPPIWSEEVPKTLFVWLTFLCAGLATKWGLNVRVSFLVERLAPRVRYGVEVVMHLLVLAMLIVVCVYSIPMVQLHAQFPVLATGWPRSVLSLAIPVGCLLMTWFQFGLLRQALRRYLSARDAVHGT